MNGDFVPVLDSAKLGIMNDCASTSGGDGSTIRTTPIDRPTTVRRAGRGVLVAAAAIGAVAGLALVVFVGGFVAFAVTVSHSVAPTRPKADAIVALTGGRDRVAEALGLLGGGSGRRLLISGVHPQTRAADIVNATDQDGALFACCVDLGRTAQSTAGNAVEAAEWARAHGFTSLIVVTSAYHMPRSMVELDRALPQVTKVPYPVTRTDLELKRWWAHPTTAKLLFGEYVKYIVARVAHTVPHSTATVLAGIEMGGGR